MTILHVYFGVDAVYPQRREELYDLIDLLCKTRQLDLKMSMKLSAVLKFVHLAANTGGLLSLFLGFSVLSLLEILYYISMRLFFKRKREMRVVESIDPHLNFYFTKEFVKVSNSLQKKNLVMPYQFDSRKLDAFRDTKIRY